jgi:hypothetical protein
MAGPTLTVNQADNPFVEVFVESYPADTATLRIERVSQGRTWNVRGGFGVTAGVAVLDFEAPFCVPSTYRAECFDANGATLGYTDSSTVTVWEDRSILHQPLNPQLWVNVVDRAETAETVVRLAPGETVRVEGSPYGRRIGGGRQAISSFHYTFETFHLFQADMVHRVFGTEDSPYPAVVCLRTPPPARFPRTLFLDAERLDEIDQDVRIGGTWVVFEITGDEVEPPFVGLVEPLLTYDDIDAAYGSYDLADAAYPSYTDRDRDYGLAGSS